MITGVDVSKYNSLDQVANLLNSGFAGFVICNIDDPGYYDKQSLVGTFGRPFGPYKWIYAGEDMFAGGRDACLRSRRNAEPIMGMWWDYEDVGVIDQQIVDATKGADSVGMKSGYYSNEWRVNHDFIKSQVGDRPFWLAGYPGNNDGSFPGMVYSSKRNVNLWQYSSTNGTLDVNVVVDEAWFANWVGSSVGITPTQPKGGSRVLIVHHEVGKSALTDGGIIIREFGGAAGAFGVPQEALDFQNNNNCPAISTIGDTAAWDEFILRSRNTKLGPTPMIAIHKSGSVIEAAAVVGNVFLREFGGPAGAFGVPQSAIDFGQAAGATVFPVTDQEWNDFKSRTASSIGQPVVIHDPAPTLDLSPVKLAVQALNDALAKF